MFPDDSTKFINKVEIVWFSVFWIRGDLKNGSVIDGKKMSHFQSSLLNKRPKHMTRKT